MVTLKKTKQARGTTVEIVTPGKGTPLRDKSSVGHIVIPYTQGLGESIKKICNEFGIQIHFKK